MMPILSKTVPAIKSWGLFPEIFFTRHRIAVNSVGNIFQAYKPSNKSTTEMQVPKKIVQKVIRYTKEKSVLDAKQKRVDALHAEIQKDLQNYFL